MQRANEGENELAGARQEWNESVRRKRELRRQLGLTSESASPKTPQTNRPKGSENSTSHSTPDSGILFRKQSPTEQNLPRSGEDQVKPSKYGTQKGASSMSADSKATIDNENFAPYRRGRTKERDESTSPSGKQPADLNNRLGEVAAAGLKFCPFQAVAKFPYKNVPKYVGETIAGEFFTNGKLFERSWDLYYVWSPHFDHNKPLIFITLEQFKALISEVDSSFPSLMVSIPVNAEDTGLVVNFNLHPSLRPRMLGRSNTRDEFNALENKAVEFEDASEMYPPDQRSLKAFKANMEAALEATKNKNKAAKDRKREEKVVKQQDMGRQFKRAQRYLGLRPRSSSDDVATPGLAKSFSPTLRKHDVALPPPFPFDGDVIFIAVDIEAYERNHSIITEIGIATLDTRDLHGQPPGTVGKDWHQYIRARHFRIKDYMHLCNTDFVKGCPDKFEFGGSEVVAYIDSQKAVADCFKEPFSKPGSENVFVPYGSQQQQKRNIVFLGHDTMQDVQYLQKLGYNPANLANLIEFHDTKAMYQSYARDSIPRSLGHVLYELDLEGWNLHNAGNDAVYTMQAMLGICVKSAENRGENTDLREAAREKALEAKIEAARKEAEERVRNDAKGWSGDEGDDGGVPLKPYAQSSAAAGYQGGRGNGYGMNDITSGVDGLRIGGGNNARSGGGYSQSKKKKVKEEEEEEEEEDWCM